MVDIHWSLPSHIPPMSLKQEKSLHKKKKMIRQSLYVCILEEVLFKATNCIIIYIYIYIHIYTWKKAPLLNWRFSLPFEWHRTIVTFSPSRLGWVTLPCRASLIFLLDFLIWHNKYMTTQLIFRWKCIKGIEISAA